MLSAAVEALLSRVTVLACYYDDPPNGQRIRAMTASEGTPQRATGGHGSSPRRDDVDWKQGPDHDRGQEWRDAAAQDLMDAIAALPDRAAAERFFRDLCTLRELDEMAQRWRVVQLLDAGRHYLEISRETGVSTATVTRIAQWLRHGTGGYVEALVRGAGTGARDRLTEERNP